MRYCRKCLTPETRPRVIFDKSGVCNACRHNEKKKTIDWAAKKMELKYICDDFRRPNSWDVIVPCSGGKDGSYVAWKLKYEFGMHPLCVTFSPPIQTAIGRTNLENFRNSGFDLVEIRPNPDVYRRLCRRMFIEDARSKFPFVIGIGTAISRLAYQMKIPFIIYGEEGETEYGGADIYEDVIWMPYKYYTDIYHEGHNVADYLDEFSQSDLRWWMRIPEAQWRELSITWWSKFEDWDPETHARFASKEVGLQMLVGGALGTFTNYAQLDDYLQDLHAYECFLKYGFGRATSDASIEIRRGRMSRKDAIAAVEGLDGQFPLAYLKNYLDYFQMTEKDFWRVIDAHANKKILKHTKDKSRPYVLKDDVRHNL